VLFGCAFAATTAYAQATRTISFRSLNTKETLTVTYKRNGRYVPEAMRQIDQILRDWRRNEAIRMDPKVVDLAYEVHKATGSKEPINVVSGYRSPVTNAALRRRSRGVARRSQHTLGTAIDIFLPDVPVKVLRETAMRFQGGGVGYYPTSNQPFVHIDVGQVRYWPRMSRQQLAKLFPDGDTQYIPADGRPLTRTVSTTQVASAHRRGTQDDEDAGGPTVVASLTNPSSPVVDPSVAPTRPGRSLLSFLRPRDATGSTSTAAPAQTAPAHTATAQSASTQTAAASGQALREVPPPQLRPVAIAVASAAPTPTDTPASVPTDTPAEAASAASVGTDSAVIAIYSGLMPPQRPDMSQTAGDSAPPPQDGFMLASAGGQTKTPGTAVIDPSGTGKPPLRVASLGPAALPLPAGRGEMQLANPGTDRLTPPTELGAAAPGAPPEGVWSNGLVYQPPTLAQLASTTREATGSLTGMTAPHMGVLPAMMRSPHRSLEMTFDPLVPRRAEASFGGGSAVAPLRLVAFVSRRS
jgi:uncharacterized protein YcbK (DUF882 family)